MANPESPDVYVGENRIPTEIISVVLPYIERFLWPHHDTDHPIVDTAPLDNARSAVSTFSLSGSETIFSYNLGRFVDALIKGAQFRVQTYPYPDAAFLQTKVETMDGTLLRTPPSLDAMYAIDLLTHYFAQKTEYVGKYTMDDIHHFLYGSIADHIISEDRYIGIREIVRQAIMGELPLSLPVINATVH